MGKLKMGIKCGCCETDESAIILSNPAPL